MESEVVVGNLEKELIKSSRQQAAERWQKRKDAISLAAVGGAGATMVGYGIQLASVEDPWTKAVGYGTIIAGGIPTLYSIIERMSR